MIPGPMELVHFHNSESLNHHDGYIITGDLWIIENKKLCKIISKGPNYREPTTINWKEK